MAHNIFRGVCNIPILARLGYYVCCPNYEILSNRLHYICFYSKNLVDNFPQTFLHTF
jgi:hypothetical protein